MESKEPVSKLSMPSLSNLELSLRSKRELGKFLGIQGPPTNRGKKLADWFVRLTEKAILEYESSRIKLVKFLEEGYADDYFRSQDHFETCINSLHKCIQYLDRLRGLGFKSSSGETFIPRPKDLEVLNDKVRNTVRNFRDACEHLDQDIVKPDFRLDREVGIHMGWKEANILENIIQYSDVAKWLRQIHHFALLLSQVKVLINS